VRCHRIELLVQVSLPVKRALAALCSGSFQICLI